MAPSPLSGLRRPVPLLAVEAAVDQAAHSARALRVLGAVVPVHLAPLTIPAHPLLLFLQVKDFKPLSRAFLQLLSRPNAYRVAQTHEA